MTKPPFSVIVAAHNEQENIPILLERFAKAHAKLPFELIIVNDGSTDDTDKVTKAELKKQRYSFVRLISYPKNRGYGGAITTGLKAAKADILAWTHADLQTDPLDVVAAYQKFIQSPLEHKIIKGRRINRPLGPTLFTFFMSVIASLVFGRAIFDINAQPKLFNRRFYERLTNPPTDFSLDLYLLVMTKKLGYSILIVPVGFGKRLHGQSKWAATFSSRLKTIRRSIQYIFALRKQLGQKASNDRVLIWLTIAIATVIGMQITHFWQWPSNDILPVIARFRDPDFLTNDLYTNINGNFSARFYFAHLVDILSRIFKTDPAVMISYLNPVVFAIAGFGLYRFTRGIGLPSVISGVATIIILANFIPQPTLGLWHFSVNQFVPSWVAASLLVVALAMAQKDKLWATIAAMVGAGLLHPTLTLVAAPLVATVYLIDEQKRWSADKGKHWLILIAIVAFVAIIFFLVPSRLLATRQNLQVIDSGSFYHLFVEIRHPHHYLASAWPKNDWYRFIAYSVTWFVLAAILRKQKQPRWIVDNTIIFAIFNIGAVVAHIVLVNGLNNRIPTILSPIRLIGIVWPFFLIFAAKAVYNLEPFKILVDRVSQIKLASRIGALMTVIAAVVVLEFYGNAFRQKIQAEKSQLIASDQAFYNCVQQKVPADSQVIVHPQFDSVTFRMRAKRAVYGDDVFPFNELYIPLWWQQYKTVHGETPVNEITSRYDRFGLKDFKEASRGSGVNYFLVRDTVNENLQKICQMPFYKLVKLP